jgi:hypothetical protein
MAAMKTRDRTKVNGISRTARAVLKVSAAALAWGAGTACSDQQAPAGVPTLESGGVNPCQQRVATWQAQQATITGSTPAERLGQIRSAAQKVGEDPEGCTGNLIDSAMADELRKVLVLESTGRKFPAPVIYSCPQLSDGTLCSGRTADETAILGEAPEEDAAVPAGAQASAVLMPDFPVTALQWYRALDSALLENPAAAVPLTPQADGSLLLPRAEESNLLFAIGRGPSGEFHKWVWIVRGAARPQPSGSVSLPLPAEVQQGAVPKVPAPR